MNITIQRKKLAEAISLACAVIGTKNTLPILGNCLIVADKGKLKITGTDLDITTTVAADCTVVKPGRITLPAKRLQSIINTSESEDVEMEMDDKLVVKIVCGGAVFRIPGLSHDEFPPAPSINEEKLKFSASQPVLRQSLNMVAYAQSIDESRYVLNGVFVDIKDAVATFVATDGRRLALCKAEVNADASLRGSVLLPSKAVNELMRHLKKDGLVDCRTNNNMAIFTFRDDNGVTAAMVTKLIDGNYPNYHQVIPEESKETIPVSRDEILSAVRRVSLMTSEKSNSVKLNFTKNELALTANSPDIGEGRESVAVKFAGKDVAIAYNPRYLADCLAACPDDDLQLGIVDELSPCKVTWKTCGGLSVIMPMRLT